MALLMFPPTLQYRLDELNVAYHELGERTDEIRQKEKALRRYLGRDLTLAFAENIGEYGIFSAYEPYNDDEE